MFILGNESTKKNKTRLGKMMSKAANTVGSLAFLSPKKVSSEQDRHSLSSTTNHTNKPILTTSRYSTSTAPLDIPRKRPESLPVSRHSESHPIKTTLSNRTTSQRYPTTTQHNKTVVDTRKISQQPLNHSTRIEARSTLAESVDVTMHTGEVLCLFFYRRHLIIGNRHSLIIIYMLFSSYLYKL